MVAARCPASSIAVLQRDRLDAQQLAAASKQKISRAAWGYFTSCDISIQLDKPQRRYQSV